MQTENPYQSTENPSGGDEHEAGQGDLSSAYNVVSDTVTGVNIRKSDNIFQAKFIACSVLICGVIGAIGALMFGGRDFPWLAGAAGGVFIGLLGGVLTSGTFLMFYRGARHLRGKHD